MRTRHPLTTPERKPRFVPVAVIVAVALVGVTAGAWAEGPNDAGGPNDTAPSTPLMTFGDETSVAWVLVPVTVRDRHRAFVTGLRARDFRLVVDGRYQAFESFDAEAAAPVSLIHLQDLSGSMAVGGKLAAAQAALACFVDTLRPADEIAVASFGSGRLTVEVPFTRDAEAAREAAAGWQGYGRTALHDAVGWLPEISLEGRYPRRAAILLTDGADNASTLSAHRAREMVQRAQLPVYVLAFDTKPSRPSRKHQSEASPTSNRALLETLAVTSGGGFFALDTSPKAIEKVCHQIASELRHQYVLGFRVATEGAAADHRLRVEVTYPRTPVVVTHRASFHGGATLTNRRAPHARTPEEGP